MSYNTANVDDMTRPRPDLPDPNFTETAGTRAWEPHPWGGVPGIFKQLADQAGVEFDVSLSTRNAASLRGHFLNTANADWDLRGNIAKRKWDIVVLQEQSDAALPAGRGANANYPAVQRLRGQDREVHPRRHGGKLPRARDVHGDLRQRGQLRRGRRHARPRATTTRSAQSPPTRTQIRTPRST